MVRVVSISPPLKEHMQRVSLAGSIVLNRQDGQQTTHVTGFNDETGHRTRKPEVWEAQAIFPGGGERGIEVKYFERHPETQSMRLLIYLFNGVFDIRDGDPVQIRVRKDLRNRAELEISFEDNVLGANNAARWIIEKDSRLNILVPD